VRLVALLAILSSLCLANHVRAQPSEAPALNVVRAPGAERCIDPATLTQRVEELTGPVFVPSSATRFVMEVHIAALGTGFRVVIAVAGRGVERHTRVLEEASSDCHKLDAPLIFILALTVDPRLSLSTLPAELQGMFGQEEAPEEALLAELDRAPPVAVETDPEANAALAPDAAPAAPPLPPVARHYVLRAGAALSLYTLPGSSWGFGLALASDVTRWFWLALSMRAHPFAKEETLLLGKVLVMRSYGLSLLACPLYGQIGSVFALACAGPTLDLVSGRGRGFQQNHRALLWLPGLAVGATLRLPLLWRVGLSVDIEGRVAFTSPRFVSKATSSGTSWLPYPDRYGLALVFGAYIEF
jgi:hypothetical protein